MKLLSPLREISYFARVLVKRARYTNRQKKSPPRKTRQAENGPFFVVLQRRLIAFPTLRKIRVYSLFIVRELSLSKLGSLRTCFTSPYIRVNLVACLALWNKLLFSEEKLTTGIRALIKIHILKI